MTHISLHEAFQWCIFPNSLTQCNPLRTMSTEFIKLSITKKIYEPVE